MEHLLHYDSCSSSSDYSSARRDPTSTSNRKRHRNDVDPLTPNEQTALLSDTANNLGGTGSGGNCEESSFDINEEGGSCKGETRVNKRHRREIGSLCAPRVIIVGDCTDATFIGECNNTEDAYLFERSNPHWEGRWAGHLFLPFPPLHQLDAPDDPVEKEDSLSEPAIDKDETNHTDTSDESDAGIYVPIETRVFLPAARELVRHWADQLRESLQQAGESAITTSSDDECNISNTNTVTIIPHLPMKTKRSNLTAPDKSPPEELSLHVSLSRPIYLPAPSVDSFLQTISICIQTVLSVSNLHSDRKQNGRMFHMRPREAAIFTNDQQNRSFLTIPICGQNAQWVKRVLLPPIDKTMKKFGLNSYYSEEGENCVLHVSVASVKGNMVKVMADARSDSQPVKDCHSSMRYISLFASECKLSDAAKCIPATIPIRLDTVQCQFGEVKGISIKL